MDASEIYRQQNLGRRLGFGRRAGIVVIDFVNGFNDATVLGGGNIDRAIQRTSELLALVHQKDVPVAFTRIVYPEGAPNAGSFATKVPSLRELTDDNPQSHIVPKLKVRKSDYVLNKTQASAFFGTDFCGWLQWQNIDTLLVTGCTTSGCVRATVVDACSYNFRPIVIEECVGDRAIEPHNANLFDMNQKYADVLPLADVSSWLVQKV